MAVRLNRMARMMIAIGAAMIHAISVRSRADRELAITPDRYTRPTVAIANHTIKNVNSVGSALTIRFVSPGACVSRPVKAKNMKMATSPLIRSKRGLLFIP